MSNSNDLYFVHLLGHMVNRDRPWNPSEQEPVFALRASDELAITAILAYRELCVDNKLSDARLCEIVEVCQAFKAWQTLHPMKVRLPGTPEKR